MAVPSKRMASRWVGGIQPRSCDGYLPSVPQQRQNSEDPDRNLIAGARRRQVNEGFSSTHRQMEKVLKDERRSTDGNGIVMVLIHHDGEGIGGDGNNAEFDLLADGLDDEFFQF